MSHSQVQEVDTALAERALALDERVPIPSHLDRNVSVVFAADNNDRLEETPTGANTTHCTNSVLVQRTASTVSLPSAQHLERHSTKHRRSLRTASILPCPEHNAGKRRGPGTFVLCTSSLVNKDEGCRRDACQTDLAWFLARLPFSVSPSLGTDSSQKVPNWSGFNAALHLSKIPNVSRIGYLPVINASPTELSTVRKVLENASDVAKQLQQEDIVVVFDQAIYAKAQEILWKSQAENPHLFRNIVVRLGAFHTVGVMLAVLGKRFGDAGLHDLLVEAEVVATGSVDAVLGGKHYNRAMRAHKIAAESLQRMRWLEFESWLLAGEAVELPELDALQQCLRLIRSKPCEDVVDTYVNQLVRLPSFLALQELYGEFCQSTASIYPMSKFWGSYIDMVDLLLRFVRATKEGNWKLHLQCVKEMLPWMFAYDRVNYSRYLSVYWCEMEELASKHPHAYQQMERGEFAVQRSANGAW